MEKPTKEEVLEKRLAVQEFLNAVHGYPSYISAFKFILRLMDAHLALTEEVQGYKDENFELIQALAKLKAETQALTEEVETKGKVLDRYRESARLLNRKRVELEAKNQALKATTDNIFFNIKNLPAGHERFALDCIRKLLKPMEQGKELP